MRKFLHNYEKKGVKMEKTPTARWTEKYNLYATYALRLPRFKKDLKLMNPDTTKEDIEAAIEKSCSYKRWEEAAVQGECIVCGDLTLFKSKDTGKYVCCDKCLYEQLPKQTDKKRRKKKTNKG